MAYWLIKSEPGSWSWDDQVKAGAKGTSWDGVRNHQAKLNLMKMKKGDRAFFYHSGDEKSIVGIVEIVGEQHPDSTDKTGKFVARVRCHLRRRPGSGPAGRKPRPIPCPEALQDGGRRAASGW
jgi:hypothetical protein